MSQQITIVNDDLDLSFKNEASILELLLKHDINIDHSCGGMGSCGTCRILVKSDLKVLPERNEVELERAEDLQFEADERLACQLCPLNNLKIEIP
ncbi:MAG: 2Fe-2S iron-sulfur cluster-binding protein [Bdellovibrionota bacterium]